MGKSFRLDIFRAGIKIIAATGIFSAIVFAVPSGYGLVTPHQVDSNQSPVAITHKATNTNAVTADRIKKVLINIPSGFTYISLGALTASPGRNWTSSYSGGIVTLSAAGAGDYLQVNEYAQIVINISTAAEQASTAWSTTLYNSLDSTASATEQYLGDLGVAVSGLSATALATAPTVSTHAVDGAQSPVAITYKTTNSGTDSLSRVVITVPSGFTIVSASALSASGAKSWTVSTSAALVTLTASGAANNINNGEFVKVNINVATQSSSQAMTIWPAVVTGSYLGTAAATENAAGDMKLQIKSLLAAGTVLPHEVYGSLASTPITCKTINTGEDSIKQIRITIPSGFTYISTGILSVSGAKTWTASGAGTLVTLTASGASTNYVNNGEFVQAVINVTTQADAQMPVTWACTVTGNLSGVNSAAEAISGDLQIEIVQLLLNGLVTPHQVYNNLSSVPVAYKITNAGSEILNLVSITIPSGFTYVSTTSISASAAKTWTSSYGTGTHILTLIPGSVPDNISIGQYVQVEINVATQAGAQPAVTWPAAARGVNSGIAVAVEASTGDMKVEIVTLGSTGLALPHIVSAGEANIPVTYQLTNTGTDSVKNVLLTIPAGFTYVSAGGISASSGKSWSTSYDSGSHTLTLTAFSAADWISNSQYVQVTVNVATQAGSQAATPWPAVVTGGIDGAAPAVDAAAGDRNVEIYVLLSYSLVSPHIVDGGQSSLPVTCKLTNGGSEDIKLIVVTVPAGFTYVSTGSISASGIKNWTAGGSGTLVTLTPSGPADYITKYEFVQADISVNTQAAAKAATAWPVTVTGTTNSSSSSIESVQDDMKVEIRSLSATSTAAPQIVDGGQTGVAITYRITSTCTDTVKKVVITIPAGFTFNSLGAVTASPSRNWSAGGSGTLVTLTPSGVPSYLNNGEYVQVIINVDTQPAPLAPAVWDALITGNYNGTAVTGEAALNDKKVSIKSLLANCLITPNVVDGGQSSQSFTYSTVNKGTTSITSVRITVPSGFSYIAAGTVTAPNGKNWTATGLSIVTLKPAGAGDYITTDEYVEIVFTASTQLTSQAKTIWPAQVTGNYGGVAAGTEAVADNMKVEIKSLTASGLCTPHIVDGGQAATQLTYKLTNTGDDQIRLIQVTVPAGFSNISTGTVTAGTKHWTAGYAAGLVTLVPVDPGDYIDKTEYVQVVINADTQSASQAAIAWPAGITGANNGIAQAVSAVAGDLQVEIRALSAYGLVTPRQVYVSSPVAITCRAINSGFDLLKKAVITIPAGFTFSSVSTASASAGKAWTAGGSGTLVTLTANSGAEITNAEWVEVPINVTTQASYLAPVTWPISVTGYYNGITTATEQVTNNMKVETITLTGTATATPHIVDGGQAGQPITYRVVNTGEDTVRIIQITIPSGFTYASLGAVTASRTGWTAVYSGGLVTVSTSTLSNYIAKGEFVQVVINTATQAAALPATVWPVIMTGGIGGTSSASEAAAGDMKVQIVPLSATASIISPVPRVVDGGQASLPVTYEITNRNTDTLKQAVISLPSGFTCVSLGVTTASGGKTWSAVYSAFSVTLSAAGGAGNYLNNTETVRVIINVSTQSASVSATAWPSVVTGSLNGTASCTEQTAGDMKLQIKSLLAAGLVTPHQIYNSTGAAVTCRATNTGDDDIKLIRITIPSGFTYLSLGAVSATGGKTWGAALGGTTITLTPGTSGDNISTGQYVQVLVNISTQAAAQAATAWPLAITGSLNGVNQASETTSGDMKVEIVTLNSTATAMPHAVNSSQNVTIAYTVNNTGTDRLKKVVITVPAGFSSITTGAVTAAGGKIWSASTGGSLITLTPATASDYLSNGQSLGIPVGVLTQASALPAATWPAQVTGENNNTAGCSEAVLNDMKVAIVTMSAFGLATPNLVDGGQASQTVTYRITSTQSEKIKSASITIPAGFTYAGVSAPVVSNGLKSWGAAAGGTVVTLTANTAGDYLDNTEYVQVVITVTTQVASKAATSWPAALRGASDTVMGVTEQLAGNMQVEIRSLSAFAAATPHIVGAGLSTLAITYNITNTGADNIKKALITVPAGFTYVSLGAIFTSTFKNWSGSYSAGAHVVTLAASTTGDNIVTSEYVQGVIYVSTQASAQAPVSWPCTATGFADGTAPATENTAGDVQVEIKTLAATAALTPHQVYNSLASTPVTCRIINSQTDKIKQARITIPSGFSFVTLGAITASGGKAWIGAGGGTTVTIQASTALNYISNLEYVEVVINTATQAAAQAATAWPVTVTGESNAVVSATEALASDMKIEIVTLTAYGLITPHLVHTSSFEQFIYKVTNSSGGSESLKQVQITVPAGFTYSTCLSVTASAGKSWSASYGGGIVTLTPGSPGNYIVGGEFVQVVINATTSAVVQAAVTWPATVTGSINGTASAAESSSGDMKVAITTLSATAVITPHIAYCSTTAIVTCRINNTNVDTVAAVNIIIPSGFTYVSLGSVAASSGKNWVSSFGSGMITVQAVSAADYLVNGDSIIVLVTVSTQAAAQLPTAWPVIVTDSAGGTAAATEVVAGDMKINLIAYFLTVTPDAPSMLALGVVSIKANLVDTAYVPKVGALITFSVVSGTGTTSATLVATDGSGNAYIALTAGDGDGVITVRAVYGVNNSTDATIKVATYPSLTSSNLSFVKNNIIYAKPTTLLSLAGITGLNLEYQIDNGSWVTYAVPFLIGTPGNHTVYFRYFDGNGARGKKNSSIVFVTATENKLVNYPNPFNPVVETTRLEYLLTEDADVKIEIFNLFGELVWVKDITRGDAGGKAGVNNNVLWDGTNKNGERVGNGGYICRLTAAGAAATVKLTRKIAVIK